MRVRRIMFLVVDAGRSVSGDFAQRIEGPGGVELAYQGRIGPAVLALEPKQRVGDEF